MFVDGCFHRGSDLCIVDCDGNILKGKGGINEFSVCNSINEFDLRNFVTSNVELLWKRELLERYVVVGVSFAGV